MKIGKAFEIFVKRILVNVGFSEVLSDEPYIFEGAAGQMIQGLGEAHNADVLLEPPVQTPFYTRSRLLIECKDYRKKVGLNTVRSALGLREDINHFEIVDRAIMESRKSQRRTLHLPQERFNYQVALAALNGYTAQAQNFASAHRIPLIQFDKLPYWQEFCKLLGYETLSNKNRTLDGTSERIDLTEAELLDFSDALGSRMAVAITNSGQILFLYSESDDLIEFEPQYTIHWGAQDTVWELRTGCHTYLFQLPNNIMKHWLQTSSNDIEMRKNALYYKESLLSNMVVYYRKYGQPRIAMISISRDWLETAKKDLNDRNPS